MSNGDRFSYSSEEELVKLLESRDSRNTAKVIEGAVRILQEYCKQIRIDYNSIQSFSNEQLCSFLRKFYADARKQNGESNAKSSLVSLRYGLQRHFMKERDIDIINHETFKRANDIFKAQLVQVKKEGTGEVKHKEIISEEDRKKLYSSGTLSNSTPTNLQYKVFFELMVFFCARGRENIREMTVDDFEVCTDAQGKRYVRQVVSRLTKNHRGGTDDQDQKSPRMYEEPGDPRCPVTSFEMYMSKLHPQNKALWQKPKKVFNIDSNRWYDNSPLGKNTIGIMMQTMSNEAGLSKVYTNHCIRATCISVLDESGYEARHIVGISGHKSESSIRNYSSRLSENRKRDISNTIAKKVLCTSTATQSSNMTVSVSNENVAVDGLNVCDKEPVFQLGELDFLGDNNDTDLVKALQEIEKENVNQARLLQKPQPILNFYNSNVTINYH